MLNEKDQAAVEGVGPVATTINGQLVTIREVDPAATGPATDSEDGAEAAKAAGAWKGQKQKSKKAKKIDWSVISYLTNDRIPSGC